MDENLDILKMHVNGVSSGRKGEIGGVREEGRGMGINCSLVPVESPCMATRLKIGFTY